MLSADWVTQHADEFDVFHIHFGFDAQQPEQLRALVDALQRHGKPLVYTVHDLRNPHQPDSRAHDAALDVLVPAAAAVITLTEGAAGEIRRRWQRTAAVVPHPHVVELDELAPRPAAARTFTVGIHAKSLRASMRPLPVLQALLPLADRIPELRLRFDVHRDVFDPDGKRHDPVLSGFLRSAEAAGSVDLRVHDYFTDDELWRYLLDLDLSVLPYQFGTHSGWLEACYDLGTTVLAPTCGYYADQRPCLTYQHDETGLDADSLRKAVEWAVEQRPLWQATREERTAERAAVSAAHRRIYQQVLP
jgi:glycosyltransferase involved in cell wall biosynthesis